jgi:hypothetical protein
LGHPRLRNKEGFRFGNEQCADFRTLYGAADLHPGLVILLPNVPQEKQVLMFRVAIKKLAELDDAINKLLEVDIDGENITLRLYDFPPGAATV